MGSPSGQEGHTLDLGCWNWPRSQASGPGAWGQCSRTRICLEPGGGEKGSPHAAGPHGPGAGFRSRGLRAGRGRGNSVSAAAALGVVSPRDGFPGSAAPGSGRAQGCCWQSKPLPHGRSRLSAASVSSLGSGYTEPSGWPSLGLSSCRCGPVRTNLGSLGAWLCPALRGGRGVLPPGSPAEQELQLSVFSLPCLQG